MIGFLLALLLQQSVSGTVTIGMNATDDSSGVATVQCYLDGAPLGPSFTAPTTAPSTYAFPWNTTLYTNGPHTLTAKATDRAGNVGSVQLPVTISNQPADVTPPVIQFIQPIAGSTVSGKINVQASATDNMAVQGMTLSIAGQQKASSNSGSILYNWNTSPYKKQAVQLSITAQDTAGNRSTSAVTVNVR